MKLSPGDVLVPEGKQYPEGALVADGYDETGRLLAHPLGGGMQFHVESKIVAELRIVNDAERNVALFRRGRFTLADSGEVFEGWSDGRLWNGWEMPRFERAEAERLLTWLGDQRSRFDGDRDALVSFNQDGEEEVWAAEVITITDGSRIKTYPVGAGAWIWEEA